MEGWTPRASRSTASPRRWPSPTTELRLFGKPESFERRRMGVALARGDGVDQARARARDAASKIKPVVV